MKNSFPHMGLFHLLCWAAGDFSMSCEWISQEIKHPYGQDRKTYYTVCFPSIVLTHRLMRPNSPRHSDGSIMMEIVTRIIMCKLLKSSCSQGFYHGAPPIACDRPMNVQKDRSLIEQLFNLYLIPTPSHVSICWKKLNWPLKQHWGSF